MGNRRHSDHVTSSFAAILTFIIFAIGSLQTAFAQSHIITLRGDTYSGRIPSSPKLDFGSIPLRTSSQHFLMIGNDGDSVLTISNLVYPPLSASVQITFQGNFSGPIAPGSMAVVPITFTPMGTSISGSTNDVDLQGYLTVESDATAGTNSILMTGVGTYPPAASSVDVDFGKVPMGSMSSIALLLTNIGTTTVAISNITVPYGFTAFLANTNQFGGGRGFGSGPPYLGSLVPGSTTNLIVYFFPSYVGNTNSSDLAVITSDAKDPALVLVTPKGNATNSNAGRNIFAVSGSGTYPSGNFNGLFMPTNNPAFENSGYFTAQTTAKGKLHATITLAGKRYPFSGQLSPLGTVSGTIARRNLPALNVSLQFGGFGGYAGTIDDGSWTAQLFAQRAQPLSKSSVNPIPPGNYSVTIAGSTNSSIAPTNAGTANLNIKASAATRVTGTLGDGTPYSQNTIMSGAQIPLFAPLYGKRGAIMGWIGIAYFVESPEEIIVPRQTNSSARPVFPPPTPLPIIIVGSTNSPPALSVLTDSPIEILSQSTNPPLQQHIVGSLNWFKPAGIDPNYPDGFSFQTTVSGSVP